METEEIHSHWLPRLAVLLQVVTFEKLLLWEFPGSLWLGLQALTVKSLGWIPGLTL